MSRLDFDKVAAHLFQGGAIDPERSYHPFAMVVLCAREHQPALPRFKGRLVRCRLRDAEDPTPLELGEARRAANEVCAQLVRGGDVLVTCQAGWNRSGLASPSTASPS